MQAGFPTLAPTPTFHHMNENPWSRPPASRHRRRSTGRRPARPLKRIALWFGGVIGFLLLLNWLFPGSAIDGPGDILAIVTAVAIGSLIIVSLRLRLSEALRYGMIWAGIVGLLAIGYAYRHELLGIADRVAASAVPERGYQTGEAMVFERGRDGHFRVEAEVNGRPVTFLVDTGASNVVLSPADARRIGLDPAPDRYFERYYTANGVVMAAPVLLDKVHIGSIRLTSVRASVTQSDLGVSLLGMSLLNELSGFRIEGDRLMLEP